MLKVWRATPKGFLPVVRVSAVDFVQAWALARSATQLTAEGKHEEALLAWQNAAANDLGNPDLARGGLEEMLRVGELMPRNVIAALNQSSWLLRLGRTNLADVELVARVYARCGQWPQVYELLRNKKGQRTPTEETAYLRAAFHAGHEEEFGRLWGRAGASRADSPDPALYEAAYLAGWGPVERRSEGVRRLEEAFADPAHRVLALRMQLVLAARVGELADYQKALEALEEVRADRLADHLGHWRLLRQAGRGEEARNPALVSAARIVYPWEALDLARGLAELGMREEAIRFSASWLGRHGDSVAPWSMGLWTLYGGLLLELRKWDELEAMANQIRLATFAYAELAGFAHFMEGRALQGRERHALARQSYELAVKRSWPFPEFGLVVAETLNQVGHDDLAQKALEPLDAALGENPAYWHALFQAIYAQKQDFELLYKAADRAYRLAPHDPVHQHNYAAALLINRWRPDEACALTRDLLARNPRKMNCRINHGFALAMNHRFDEARAVLASISAVNAGEPDRTAYHLASFEVSLHGRRFDEARRHSVAIDRRLLFPNQIQWLRAREGELEGQ